MARWLVAMLFGLVAVEMTFRLVVFPQWGTVGFTPFVSHPVYGTFQKPNLTMRRYNPPNYDVHNSTNSQGFRDREQGFDRDLAGVWVAGGSNSYGAFVEDEETYAARLQAIGFPNALLASEGHRMPDQAKVLRDLARRGHRPRAVLVEITVYNHLFDYSSALAAFDAPLAAEGGRPRAAAGAAKALVDGLRALPSLIAELDLIAIKGRLINNSALYCWLKTGLNGIPSMRELTLKVGLRADPDLALGGPIELLDKDGHDFDLWYSTTADFAARMAGWTERELGVPFAMIVIPSRFQLESDRFARFARRHGLDPSGYDPGLPYRRMVEELRARGIKVFAAGSVLEGAEGPLAFPDDGHMNRKAHDIVARGLADWLPANLELEPGR